MTDIESQPWAEFAERFAKELIENGASEAATVTRNESLDRVVTNYFNCNFEKRCVMVGHLLEDLILEVIETNAEAIREILEEEND